MDDGQLPHADDPDPIDAIQGFSAALCQSAHVAHTMVRKELLEKGPDPDDRHGLDVFR
ncbi:hypothetical protein [Ensifer sp. BR816]|uniref:hypothetical protein n=1 Tax=Rhizobium sp. (strain BR816) TaxID=1057002 RepID=UPI00036F44D2|nr:hypothetical protein [Ensifer sp. BR816]